jgi:RNA polymerase sigma factor (sigma-70 family)
MSNVEQLSTKFESSELYAACGSEDTAVKSQAYRTLWAYLYQIAYSIVLNQPDADALAQDCAQRALVRVHDKLNTCEEPRAFRVWSRRIVHNLTIDELRRRKRFQPLDDNNPTALIPSHSEATPENEVLPQLTAQALRDLLAVAPISDRSRRVVIGRFLDNLPDDQIAQAETDLANAPVRPSHVQVTRAKNLAKLRKWQRLEKFLKE